LVSKHKHLEHECSTVEEHVKSYNQKLSIYDELQYMGFGLKELKLLRDTINEIAQANNIPANQAQQKFYKHIEEQYDDKLGFELQLNKLRSEIAIVNTNLNVSRTALLAQPLVGPSLQRLFSRGIVEQDIVELANLFERSNAVNDSGNRTKMDIQSLMSGLQEHGGRIKSAIQELSDQADILRNQIGELQRQKQGLDEQNQNMLSIIAYSKPLDDFLNRQDHLFTNDEDNLKILIMIGLILYSLYFRYVGLEKLADDDLYKSFARLSKDATTTIATAAGREEEEEEAVSIPELKKNVAKVLRVLIAKSK
jgi:hypothetical protein